jgi:phage/plasmid-like protein (TIGR03299 family)
MNMPANIGEMFYYGNVPWHGKGTELNEPANKEEAIVYGGLDWEVEMVPLRTDEEPSSKVGTRVGIARKDKPKGHPERVLGVTHKGFKPLQNREGIRIFDAIFGKGKRVYHTGGYLGAGEVIWLLAKLPKNIQVEKGDQVIPYALFTNSHNGSIAIDFRLTTVRVVCQNTLSVALTDKNTKTFFKSAHQGDYSYLQLDVETFFEDTLEAVDELEDQFKQMMNMKFDDDLVKEYIESVFPIPVEPRRAKIDQRTMNQYLSRVEKTKNARMKIAHLRLYGKGSDLPGVNESLWGTFNAVLEYVDHNEKGGDISIPTGLFGPAAAIKRKAFGLALQYLS